MEQIDGHDEVPPTGDSNGVDLVAAMAAHHDRIADTVIDRSHDGDRALDMDAATTLAHRFLALSEGNAAQRRFAALIERAVDLAEATRAADEPDADDAAGGADSITQHDGADSAGDDDPVSVDDGYRAAMAGIDALESLTSAVEAARSRLITRSYAYAHEELHDRGLAPGHVIRHRDGSLDRIESRAQITATALAMIIRTSSGRALMLTEHAVQLCAHMPHTLARLDAGELTAYQASLITREAHALNPEQAAALDDAVCGQPFTGAYAGLSEHRAPLHPFRHRLNKAVKAFGLRDTAESRKRQEGHKDRYVRFGLSSHGMTSLHGLLPDIDAAAINTMLDDYAHTTTGGSDGGGDQRTHEQRRADVFRALFLGPAALSPAAQLAFEYETTTGHSAASYDEDGRYTIVNPAENLDARGIYDTIRLLTVCLDWTLPNPAKAVVNVDITAEVLAQLQASIHAARDHDSARDHERQPGPPGDASPSDGPTTQSCPEPGPAGQSCPEPGPAGQSCPEPGPAGQCCPESGPPPHDGPDPDPGRRPGRHPESPADADTRSTTPSNTESCAPTGMFPPPKTTPDSCAPADTTADSGAPCETVADSCGPRGPGGRYRPATVRGIGEIPDTLLRALIENADWRRIITDPRTGHPIDIGRRRPSRALRDATLNRDRQCRWPGCTRTAAVLDLDHVQPRRDDQPAAGQTTPQNLAALCRAHHRAKHHLRWSEVANDDGTITYRNNLLDITATS